jgi:hypothetical protein
MPSEEEEEEEEEEKKKKKVYDMTPNHCYNYLL